LHRAAGRLKKAPSKEQSASDGLSRLQRHILVVLFLAIQIALPAHYYLFSDPYDERFAWRMYSSMRMVKCQTAIYEGQGAERKKIKLSREIGMPWVKGISRGKLRVLHAYADRRCAEMKAEGKEAKLYASVRCKLPDGSIDLRANPREDLCAP